MIIKEFDFPWKHIVIDNFLNKTEFKQVIEYSQTVVNFHDVSNDFIEIHHYDRGSILNKIFNDKIIQLADLYYDKLNYSNKSRPADAKPFIALKKTMPNSRFLIHADQEFKIMSSVLYLYPRYNTGTELYKSELENPVKTVKWRQNRLVSFVGQPDPNYQITWHNYANETSVPRISVVLVLSK